MFMSRAARYSLWKSVMYGRNTEPWGDVCVVVSSLVRKSQAVFSSLFVEVEMNWVKIFSM